VQVGALGSSPNLHIIYFCEKVARIHKITYIAYLSACMDTSDILHDDVPQEATTNLFVKLNPLVSLLEAEVWSDPLPIQGIDLLKYPPAIDT
jgi:hypothetical protein